MMPAALQDRNLPDSQRKGKAKDVKIGQSIDEAMSAIEGDNPSLKGLLPKDYARPSLDKPELGQLIDLIATIGLGDAESRRQDILWNSPPNWTPKLTRTWNN